MMKKTMIAGILLVFLVGIFSACTTGNRQSEAALTQSTPTRTPIPITPTPTPTATATPFPQFEVITADNVDQVQMLHRLGKGAVETAAFSPDSSLFAIGSSIGIYILENATKQQILFLDTDLPVNEIRFTPDSSLIVGACFDGSIWVWQVQSGELLFTFHIDTEYGVYHIDVSKDGAFLAANSDGGSIYLWNLSDGSQASVFDNSRANILDLGFLPDGNTLAVVCEDGTIRFYDYKNWTLLEYKSFLTTTMKAVNISPDGRWLAISCQGPTYDGFETVNIVIWSLVEREQVKTVRAEYLAGARMQPYFSMDGKLLAGVSINEYEHLSLINLWETASWGQLNIFYSDASGNVAFSPDGNTMALFSSNIWIGYDSSSVAAQRGGYKIDFLKTDTQESLGRYLLTENLFIDDPFNQPYEKNGVTETISGLAFSNNDHYLVSFFTDGRLCLWDIYSGQLLKTTQAHTIGRRMAISVDGDQLATTGDNSIRIWSVPDFQQIGSFETDYTPVTLSFSADGKHLAVLSQDGDVFLLVVYELRLSGANIVEVSRNSLGIPIALAYSPVQDLIALSINWHKIMIWDSVTSTQTGEFRTYGSQGTGLEFSPDGKLLATGGYSLIEIFDIQDGTRIQSSQVSSDMLHFSPNQELLFSSGLFQYLGIFRVSDLSLLRDVDTHTFYNHALAVSSDGKLLATGSANLVIRVWGIPK